MVKRRRIDRRAVLIQGAGGTLSVHGFTVDYAGPGFGNEDLLEAMVEKSIRVDAPLVCIPDGRLIEFFDYAQPDAILLNVDGKSGREPWLWNPVLPAVYLAAVMRPRIDMAEWYNLFPGREIRSRDRWLLNAGGWLLELLNLPHRLRRLFAVRCVHSQVMPLMPGRTFGRAAPVATPWEIADGNCNVYHHYENPINGLPTMAPWSNGANANGPFERSADARLLLDTLCSSCRMFSPQDYAQEAFQEYRNHIESAQKEQGIGTPRFFPNYWLWYCLLECRTFAERGAIEAREKAIQAGEFGRYDIKPRGTVTLDATIVQGFILDGLLGPDTDPLQPEWFTSTVTALARTMYEQNDFSPCPILADALQDAGCECPEVLNRLRTCPVELIGRGDWLIDRLRGFITEPRRNALRGPGGEIALRTVRPTFPQLPCVCGRCGGSGILPARQRHTASISGPPVTINDPEQYCPACGGTGRTTRQGRLLDVGTT